MKRSILPISLLALAAFAVPAQLSAQCPANPLSVLSGPWTFNVQGLPIQGAANNNSFAIAGQFRASIGADRAGNPIGVLTINATSSINGSTTRSENDIGRFQINSTCTGGTLIMNLSSYPMQYDFSFYNGGQSIYIVSTLAGRDATGSATVGVAGCPAGNPLTLFSGNYALKLQHIAIAGGPFQDTHGMAGRLVASTDGGATPRGLLAITATSNFTEQHSVTRLERDAGSYQINDDCSGGTLIFNLSSRPLQYQFYFRAGFQELDVISISGVAIYGVISRAVTVACPANTLSLLNGPWTFNVQTIVKDRADANWAAVGRFRASVGADRLGNPTGVLNINATSLSTTAFAGLPSPTRLENDFGSFQINEDCTGGTLIMNLSSFPMQYDFWFYNNNQSIYFVSTSPGRGATGSATVGVSGCPVGLPSPSPLSILSGTYGFKFQRIPNFTVEPFGIAGLLTASTGVDPGGNPAGLLAITATSSIGLGGSIARLEGDVGRYQINDDCSGGTLIFNLSSRPAQYEFYFRAGFQSFDVISQVGPSAFGEVSR